MGQQLDNLGQDVAKEGVEQQNSHGYIDGYLHEDLPKIADQLQNEINERKDIEEKIYQQFVEQLNDLKEMFETEKKEREMKEEEILNTLKLLQVRISDDVKSNRKEREKTEEEMVGLVEKMIHKIKAEMLEMNI